MKKTYAQKQSEIVQQAIDWQLSFSYGVIYSWQELADACEYFQKMGKRYGLLKNFRENGVL